MQVRWGSTLSRTFGVANGVKQGGILSPILFNLYMDLLLERLKSTGVGCHVEGIFVGALAYADDLTILSPSLQSLQSMLNVCQDFGEAFSVSFNPNKTQCIQFCRGKEPGSYNISLDGKLLQWVKHVKHLGHIVSYDLSEANETNSKVGGFIYQVNFLRAHFKGVDVNVIIRLFRTYCTAFYGSQAWDFSQQYVHNVYSKFNRGVRLLLRLPFKTHRNILPILLNCHMPELLLVKRFHQMHCKMNVSTNSVIRDIASIMLRDQRSILAKNLCLYNRLMTEYTPPSDELLAKCLAIKEIIDVLNVSCSNSEILCFNTDELCLMLNDLCTR